MSGPLEGIRVVEIAGIGPGPFAAMMLADMGAEVIRVDRVTDRLGPADKPPLDVINRGRRSIAVDLKRPEGAEIVLRLAEVADALFEPFRPGVAERLGIGPEACIARNGRLIYGRMTGWGQDGPYAERAGHDINYIAIAGALAPIGRRNTAPVPPLNLVGDFGGGGMLLAFGLACALIEARSSGVGQVVDAAMVDGAALLTTLFHGLIAEGRWEPERGTNLIDTGAHFYEVYETADGEYLSVGAIEPQFYAELLRLTGLDFVHDLPEQRDKASWPTMKTRLAQVFRTRTRAAWCEVFEGADACVAPVLGLKEATTDPHLVHRKTFVDVAGVEQPAPAPRFSRTPGLVRRPPPHPGQHTDEVLAEWLGMDADSCADLRASGALG